MKINSKVPHGEMGHEHDENCPGYAQGGRVKEQLMEGLERNRKEIGLPGTEGGLSTLIRAVPGIGLVHDINEGVDLHNRLVDPEYLHNTAGKGLETNIVHGSPRDTYGKEADIPMMAEGGTVEEPAEIDEKKDPSEIPEEIREFVEKTHKKTQESRPDEGWHLKRAEKPESIAPYKRDEEAMEAEKEEMPVVDRLKALEMPHFDEGGEMPDRAALLQQLEPQGAGLMGPGITPQAPQPPDPTPAEPAPAAPPPSAAPVAPVSSPPAAPPPTDQDFMNRANKMLGLGPDQQAGFMKLLGDRSQKAQLGAGIAGIGDAIAAGGTLGKVNPGALNKSEDLIQGRTKEGLEGLQGIREGQKESFGLGQTLRGNEPFSPEIQKSLVKQFHIPAALAGSPRDVIYKMLDPIAQTQLKEAELASANSYKTQALDLQKKQLEATIGNQKAERDIAQQGRTLEAAKAAESRGIVDKAVGLLPWTTAHKADKAIEGALTNFSPDVSAYAQKHGITPEQAQAIKDKRMGGQ